MQKSFKYYNDTYGARVHLLINATAEEAQEYLRRKLNCKGDLGITPSMGGLSVELIDKNGKADGLFIWIRSFDWRTNDYESLSHECLHIAEYILRRRGITLGNKQVNHCFYYLQGTIFRSFLNQISRYYKKENEKDEK